MILAQRSPSNWFQLSLVCPESLLGETKQKLFRQKMQWEIFPVNLLTSLLSQNSKNRWQFF